MERSSLDVHKKFINRCLEEHVIAGGDETPPEPYGGSKSRAKESEETRNASELKSSDASNADQTLASSTENEGNGVSEDMIRGAIKERASFFKEHLQTITFAKVRRLLEEDLNLTVKSLDAHKAFINEELEKALTLLDKNKSENSVQKKPKKVEKKGEKRQTGTKTSKRSREDDSEGKEEEHSKEVKPKRGKQGASKIKESSKNSANRKDSVEEKKSNASKRKKVAKKEREDNSDEEREGDNSSDKNESGSSDDEGGVEKRREKPTPQVYGRKVEHLKSIIKSCGLGIPPAVYKRAKQAPEDKREAFLLKELEEILEKEGLSTNPSEKEIKEVKRRKERAKELEGIDMSNIITSSRRRSSAFSYIPPPKPPKMELSSDEDDDDEEDDDVDLEKGDLNDDDGGDHDGVEGNEGEASD